MKHKCALGFINEDDGVSVIVLNLPGCGSQGDTEGEAEENVRDAIRASIETYQEDGLEIPWREDFSNLELGIPISSISKFKWIEVEI